MIEEVRVDKYGKRRLHCYVKCSYCKKYFWKSKRFVVNNKDHYCSTQCRNISQPNNKVVTNCAACDKKLELKQSVYKKSKSGMHFCTMQCQLQYRKSHPTKRLKKQLKYDLYCPQCKEIFKTNKKMQKFCSVSCSSSYNGNLPDTKERHRKRAIKNGLGGHNRTQSNNGWYISPYAGKVFLESSYEQRVAEFLDNNKIQWVRPAPLMYKDALGITHRYYPDFFISHLNIYLDPKNDYLISKDYDKISRVSEQNNVTVRIISKSDLSNLGFLLDTRA